VYVGPQWPGWDPITVVVIIAAPQPIDVIIIIDVWTGDPFERPIGGDGGTDVIIIIDGPVDGLPPDWLVGSRWFYSAMLPNTGLSEHEITLGEDGILYTTNLADTTVGNDTWRVEGNLLVWCYNDCYSTHTGEIDPNLITGTAVNIVGESWTFTMERIP
jgi:hypothetical protein